MTQLESDSQPEYIELNRIQLGYNGILSDRMEWLRPALAQFEQTSDLRSSVVIRNEDDQERIDIAQLGDTAAFKKVANIGDLFKRRESAKFMEVTTNLDNGRAEVIIYDQALVKEQEKSGTAFDQKQYIQSVDRLTREGLSKILKTEKKAMAGIAARFIAPIIPLLPIVTVAFAAELNLLIDTFNNPRNGITDLLVAVGAIFVGTQYLNRVMPAFMEKLGTHIKRNDLRYWGLGQDGEISLNIFNPIAPILRWRKGRQSLSNSKVVEPK